MYRLDAILGEGPSGAVFNSWHLGQSRAYAVKVLHQELSALTAALVRLRLENQAVLRLNHPHLQPSEVVHLEEGPPILVRPLSPGESLRTRLVARPLSLSEVARLFVVLCGALDAAHSQGVVHGDLKPENILLCRKMTQDGLSAEEIPQILDFGMLHLRTLESPNPSALCYLAPEQIRGDENAIDGRTDVFALGALLYECLTGRRAFEQASPSAIVSQICHGPRPCPSVLLNQMLPSRLPAALCDKLDSTVAQALAADQEARFSSPRTLFAALYEALSLDDGVQKALCDMAEPSAASSTLSLLPWASGQSGIHQIVRAKDVPSDADLVETRPMWPQKRRRGGNGARAVEIYRAARAASLEEANSNESADPAVLASATAEILESQEVQEEQSQERKRKLLDHINAKPLPGDALQIGQVLEIGFYTTAELEQIDPKHPQTPPPSPHQSGPRPTVPLPLSNRWKSPDLGQLPPVLGLITRNSAPTLKMEVVPTATERSREADTIVAMLHRATDPLWLRLLPYLGPVMLLALVALVLLVAVALWPTR